MGLLAPPADTHGRKGSVSSTGSTDNTLDGHGNELGLVPSNVTSNAGALSAKSVGTTVVDPDDVATEKELSKKELKDKKKKKKKGVPEEEETGHHAELKADLLCDPAPFSLKPFQLAHILDPKSFDSLKAIGGTDGLLTGLGVNKDQGLSKDSSGGDGPAAATMEDRARVYGHNVLPIRPSKSLLQLMWTAMKDKVLVRVFYSSPPLPLIFPFRFCYLLLQLSLSLWACIRTLELPGKVTSLRLIG